MTWLALEEWLTAEEQYSHGAAFRCSGGALGSGELLPCQAPPWKERFPRLMAIWKELGSAAIMEVRCHHGLDLLACILPCFLAPVRQQLLLPSEAQLFLPSCSMLCLELPSHTTGIEGHLKSLFETGRSSGKTHILLHPTFTLVSTEGMNLGGLTLVLGLILLVYLSIPKALQLVFKFMEMLL